MDTAIAGRGEIDPLRNIAWLVLLFWTAPAILLVIAIGLVGSLASKLGKPASRAAVEGAQAAHGPACPLGLAATRAWVREKV